MEADNAKDIKFGRDVADSGHVDHQCRSSLTHCSPLAGDDRLVVYGPGLLRVPVRPEAEVRIDLIVAIGMVAKLKNLPLARTAADHLGGR